MIAAGSRFAHARKTRSVILIQLLKLVPQRLIHRFELRQVKLAHLRLIRHGQRRIQSTRVQFGFGETFEHPLRQYAVEIPDANSLAVQLLQETLGLVREERLLHRPLQPGELLLLLNLDRSPLESRRHTRSPALPNFLERETGIEPATNSLEGCDSTTELLPPCNRSQLSAVSFQLKSAAKAAPSGQNIWSR